MAELRKYALGLDFGTESVRVLAVDCHRGVEVAEAVVRYEHGVISEKLPIDAASTQKLPPDFALQHAGDYEASALQALKQVLAQVPAAEISGIGVDFTACTILPVRRDGTPLMADTRYAQNPHAWVKLWKHHGAQAETDLINAKARERGEAFLKYYGGTVGCEWMLPKSWEIARHAREIYDAAELIVDAGDWWVHQMTGQWTRNSCAAGYKGLWTEQHGLPSQEFLTALDPELSSLRDKWLKNITPPGTRAGGVSKRFAALSGLVEGTPVSAATIDAHSGVAGMGVYREGSLSVIMGTSSCHMAISREQKLFEGCAGVVRDGIIPGFYGYESGQAAVGDSFAWFAKSFMGRSFESLSQQAALLTPGESGLVAVDWLNGSRTPVMDGDLSGMILGLTLDSQPHEVYRALIEATAFGTRRIVDTHVRAGIPIRELVVCGGLTQDPLILQIYADATGLPVRVAASGQAVALGAAIFGALAAGPHDGGFASMEDAIIRMTAPHRRTYEPKTHHRAAYDTLYGVYCDAAEHYGRSQHMKKLKALKKGDLS